jgi:muramidase (phage lysozyme)
VDIRWGRTHYVAPPRPRWVIPEYIVICESKGRNEPPNSASAAGYYQIIASTWAAYGGSPPNDASQHSKAEQDAVARRIWDGGRGAGQWDCA